MRPWLVSFVAVLLVGGCSLTPLQIDPCVIWPDDLSMCRAIPLNQPEKPDYDRKLNHGDVCVTQDEYAKLQKSFREIMRRCGEKCR